MIRIIARQYFVCLYLCQYFIEEYLSKTELVKTLKVLLENWILLVNIYTHEYSDYKLLREQFGRLIDSAALKFRAPNGSAGESHLS